MALRDKAVVKQAVPGFEQDDTAAAAPAAVVAEAVKVVEKANAAVNTATAAGNAVVKAASTAVAKAGKMQTAFEDKKNALPAVDFGVLQRLIGSNGQIMDSDKKQLGAKVTLKLVSFNDSFVVSPGDDSAEAKALVRYSLDGITIDSSGENVAEYLEKLRTVDSYEKANVKQYQAMVGILLATEKPTEHLNSMVEVSLSPQSRKAFDGFRLQQSVKLTLGQITEIPDDIELRAEVKTFGSNTFTLIRPCALEVAAPAA